MFLPFYIRLRIFTHSHEGTAPVQTTPSTQYLSTPIDDLLRVVERYAGARASARIRKRSVKTDTPTRGTGSPRVNTNPSDFFHRLVDFCRQSLQPHEFQEAVLDMGNTFETKGNLASAEEAYGIVTREDREGQDDAYIAEAFLRRGKLYARMGHWQLSNADLRESKKRFEERGDYGIVAEITGAIGAGYAARELFVEAERCYSESLPALASSRGAAMAGVTAMNMGIAQSILGNPAQAWRCYQDAFLMFDREGDLASLADLHNRRGLLRQALGDHQAAIQEFDEAFATAQAADKPQLLPSALLGKAFSYHALAQHTMALLVCSQVEELLADCRDDVAQAELHRLRGMIARERGDFDAASQHLTSSLTAFRRQQRPLNLGKTYFELGVLNLRCDNPTAAATAFRNAERLYLEAGATDELTKLRTVAATTTRTSRSGGTS